MIPFLEYTAQLLGLVTGLAFLGLAYWGRGRWTAHTAPAFVRLLATLGIVATLFALTSPVIPLYQVSWLYTLVAVPAMFALFCFEYYGIDYFTTTLRRVAFLTPPIIVGAAGTLLSFNPGSMGAGGRLLTAVMTEAGSGGQGMTTMEMQAPLADALGVQIEALPELVVSIALAIQELGIVYAGGVTLVATALLVTTVTQYCHLKTGLGITLTFVGVWPWAAYTFLPVVAGRTSWGTSLTVMGGCYVLALTAVGLAIGHYKLFDAEPAAGTVGPTTALNAIQEPVFVVDTHNRVLRLNTRAESTFGITDRNAIGQPLTNLIGTTVETLQDGAPTNIETVDGYRQFEPSRASIPGREERGRGAALVLRDITQRQTREQRLQVLTRVLRHNLRNDLNIIRGHAELIADGGVDPRTNAENIHQTADELLSISERAREAQRVVATDADQTANTDLGAVLTDVYATVAEAAPAAELTQAIPDDTVVNADRTTLSIVLKNIVENAIEHNDTDPPLVVTSIDRPGTGTVRVAISDNGPGLPETERAVVATGDENPLEHGSGMGLWTVKWGITRIGGTVSFADNEPRGTVVELTLPAATE